MSMFKVPVEDTGKFDGGNIPPAKKQTKMDGSGRSSALTAALSASTSAGLGQYSFLLLKSKSHRPWRGRARAVFAGETMGFSDGSAARHERKSARCRAKIPFLL